MRRFLLACLALCLGVVGPAPGKGSGAALAQGLAPDLLEQIEALRAEKAARTPIQRKISSRLLFAAKLRRGVPIAPGVPTLRSEVVVDSDGTTLVDVRGRVVEGVLERIETLGGEILSSFPHYETLRVRLPIEELEGLAELPEIRALRPADRAFTRKLDVSEGDVAHLADQARAAFGVDGTGVTVGVLSDGVDALASLQTSGDLPPDVTVLPGQAGSGSEGTAMLEIVHDLAPGASLLFATAFTSQVSFAANVLALREAGADVLVDDVGYFAEAVFQDDDVAAAVDAVVQDGALYFSSAGNGGNWNDGTAGVWEGDFVASATTVGGDPAHDFGGGEPLNEVTVDTPFVFTLQWADPLAGSGNDYDLFLTNKSGKVLMAASTDVQDGDDDPFEIIGSGLNNDKGKKLVIVRSAGASRYLHVNANRGQLAIATAGQTSGHAAARGALGVAAVDARAPGGAGGVFDGTESVETYSSDGPRRVFYEWDGTPITPGDFSGTGGEVRAKPDLAAADCVSTATPGFSPFCGTSAAAPHAAAIAALLWELGGGSVSPEQIRDALLGTALDIEAAGVDRDAGAGIADALAAADAVDLLECADGMDNDGDGAVDHPADPGCDSPDDPSEQSAALPCDDGLDNDGDGAADYPLDLGCRSGVWSREDPGCQDGLDNDRQLGTDFDGGESVLGAGNGDPDGPDPECVGRPWRLGERAQPLCGLGFEGALAALALQRLRRRASHAAARGRR